MTGVEADGRQTGKELQTTLTWKLEKRQSGRGPSAFQTAHFTAMRQMDERQDHTALEKRLAYSSGIKSKAALAPSSHPAAGSPKKTELSDPQDLEQLWGALLSPFETSQHSSSSPTRAGLPLQTCWGKACWRTVSSTDLKDIARVKSQVQGQLCWQPKGGFCVWFVVGYKCREGGAWWTNLSKDAPAWAVGWEGGKRLQR